MEEHRQGAWESTALWTQLERHDEKPAQQLRTIIAAVMTDVETILASGGTAPTDFTLHDAEHSRRVAERMAELAGPEVLGELGPYDLGMLLLSAFLHDIGMTPPLAKIDGHLAFLLSGDRSALDDDDATALQAWLDDEWDGMVPPISSKAPTVRELRLARQIVAGYVRHRHNEWSELWIRENLSSVKEPYPGWLDDLVRLCKSHHFGIDQLRSDAFSPRLVGAPGTVLHLRYCACLLRVADVLDFDPERTPGVLFAHRDVSEGSAIFWHKDQGLSFELQGNHIAIHARPADALTHHAVELTLRDVDSELLLCRRLADETHFQQMAGHDGDLPHRWTLDTNVRAVVTPRDHAYEYIDGTFRPDPKRLLALVGGIELYGSHFAAVREILQNAFDAVREQIARERLLQPDPASAEADQQIAQVHRVSLVLEHSEKHGYQLICKDTGTGMSREVIRSRFLVGGTSANHDMRALERDCNEHGFSVGRTARFGIGVLSYFILGSHLTVRTRRSLEAGDPDGTGWVFTSNGLDDFGELKPTPGSVAGTEIALTVRDELLDSEPEKFAADLYEYVSSTIRRAPCAFDFEAPGFECPTLSNPPGWIDRTADTEQVMLSATHWNRSSGPYVARNELDASEAERAHKQKEIRYEALHEQAGDALRLDTRELPLPDGLGVARVAIGIFDLHLGSSFAYMDLQPSSGDSCELNPFPNSDGGVGGAQLTLSWNGMSVQMEGSRTGFPAGRGGTTSAFIEIDWTSDAAGQLAVHRNSFSPSDLAKETIEWVLDEVVRAQLELIEREANFPLAFLNSRLMGSQPTESMSRLWLHIADDDTHSLSHLEFPAVDSAALEGADPSGLEWKGSRVSPIPQMSFRAANTSWRGLTWHGAEFAPTALGIAKVQGRIKPVMVWEKPKQSPRYDGFPSLLADFPPEWASLVSIGLELGAWSESSHMWNAGHPLLQATDLDSWTWAADTFRRVRNPLPHEKELMAAPGRVAAWIIRCLEGAEVDLWNALADHSPSFLPDAWGMVDGLAEIEEIVYWLEDDEDRMLFTMSPTSSEIYEDRDADREFARRFPAPSDEWWLTGPNGERELPPA